MIMMKMILDILDFPIWLFNEFARPLAILFVIFILVKLFFTYTVMNHRRTKMHNIEIDNEAKINSIFSKEE